MDARHLSIDAELASYRAAAVKLLAAQRAGDARALRVFHEHHPRFLDPVVRWKPLPVADSEVAAAELEQADAELAVARAHSFRDWPALEAHAAAMQDVHSPARRFELAAEAVIDGDLRALDGLLSAHPELARARSNRVTCFDPPVHRATLVHYLGANGVENHRQRSPTNAVAIARRLFEAGAEADALADMYGSACATLSLLASSTPPAESGVQVPLIHALIDAGAAVDGAGAGKWTSPVLTALVFGFQAAAQALVERGARTDSLLLAAGLDRMDVVRVRLAGAPATERHAALALAAQLGHARVVEALLDAGEAPDRFNPDGFHAHGTPLHHAASAGHLDVVRLLVRRGARRDIRDKLWTSTPLEWARHGGREDTVAYLDAL